MLGLFKTSRYTDPALGELKYSRGLWRGTLTVDGFPVPLAVDGSRSAPSAEALSLARSAQAHLNSCCAAFDAQLFSHYLDYAEAIATGEFEPEEPLPALQEPSAVRAHIRPEFAAVIPLDGTLTTELGYTVAWEQEHVLGVRFRSGAFVELCASTVAP